MKERFGITEMEVTDEVFRSKYARQFDQAENRMHSIKAIMAATLGNLFILAFKHNHIHLTKNESALRKITKRWLVLLSRKFGRTEERTNEMAKRKVVVALGAMPSCLRMQVQKPNKKR